MLLRCCPGEPPEAQTRALECPCARLSVITSPLPVQSLMLQKRALRSGVSASERCGGAGAADCTVLLPGLGFPVQGGCSLPPTPGPTDSSLPVKAVLAPPSALVWRGELVGRSGSTASQVMARRPDSCPNDHFQRIQVCRRFFFEEERRAAGRHERCGLAELGIHHSVAGGMFSLLSHQVSGSCD